MKITGILSISNGWGLEYPYPPVVLGLSTLCDNVLVGLDPSFSNDMVTVEALGLPNVEIVEAPWDRSNRNAGAEIAIQMDRLVSIACAGRSDWVVVMQADELLHEKDFPALRELMGRELTGPVNGFSLERLYFWRGLGTIRKDWNASLVRIFKPGTYSFLSEGTDKAGMYSGPLVAGEERKLSCKIYHYSRVDLDPMRISRRVRNLDSFFHAEETLIPENELPPYDFVPREYDNFGKAGPPKEVEEELVFFSGTHPLGIKEWYGV